jgi:hypothetical protein
VPVYNFDGHYDAPRALNAGIKKCNSNVIVLCHQDVLYYEYWVEMLFDRIKEIERKDKKWGVLGTAGIDFKDNVTGAVYMIDGKLQWSATVSEKVYPVQTVDEHCMIIRKDSGLTFDERLGNWHFYGGDICLNALDRGMINYGILCPLVHNTNSGSLRGGVEEYMLIFDAFEKKWKNRFPKIRTTTAVINKSSKQTFLNFNRKY